MAQQKETAIDDIRTFLGTCVVPVTEKLVSYLEDLGITEIEDFRELNEDDLNEEKTGLKVIQQRKLLKHIKEFFAEPSAELLQVHSEISFVVPNKKKTVSEESKISVRYILCYNMFEANIEEKVLPNLNQHKHRLFDLYELIMGRENIDENMTLQFYSHEGYPLNTNEHSLKLTLSQWEIGNNTLLYVFPFLKHQPVTLSSSDKNEVSKANPHSGQHKLNVYSLLYGTFQIRINLETDTEGDIIDKVSTYTSLPPSLFTLSKRGYSTETLSPKRITMGWMQDLTLTMVTKNNSTIRGGGADVFGKCTYNPLHPQTDLGYAKFFSILKYLTTFIFESDERAKDASRRLLLDKIVAFVHREYDCPPLTYALRVILTRGALDQLSFWVALVEGLFQVFQALLSFFFHVSIDKVFEFSDYLWGLIIKHSENESTTSILTRDVSLVCPLSNKRVANPVRLPRCDEIFDRLSVEEKIEDKEVIQDCPVNPLEKSQVRPASELYKRLYVYFAFQKYNDVIVWINWPEPHSKKMMLPLTLPSGCSLKEMTLNVNLLNIHSPDDLDHVEECLTYVENGKMVVFQRLSKRDEKKLHFYDPLYIPGQSDSDVQYEINKLKDIAKKQQPKVFHNLQEFVKLKGVEIEGSATVIENPAGPKLITRDKQLQDITREPLEAIVVLLDVSSSMDEDIYQERDYSRLAGAKEFFSAFLHRTRAYRYPHVIGLTTFCKKVTVATPLTEAFDILSRDLNNVTTGKKTALNDAMANAAVQLKEFTGKWTKCHRRILCLTDGYDYGSKHKAHQLAHILQNDNIVVDTVLITTTKDGNLTQKAISHATGGYCFFPKSRSKALKIFEIEPVLSIRTRAGVCAKVESVVTEREFDVFKDCSKYPYNSSDPYGSDDLQTTFAEGLDKVTFITTQRLIQLSQVLSIEGKYATSKDQVHRLLREIKDYQRNPHPDVEIFPCENNINIWKILLKAPEDSVYKGGVFVLCAKFPSNYPSRPPEMRFLTPIYHCNINSSGRICHGILDRNYISTVSMREIIDCMYGLLLVPEPDDPLDSVVASQFYLSRQKYERKANKFTEKYARKNTWDAARKMCVEGQGEINAPPSMICPLTGKLFEDPVLTPYGHTYERSALMEYLSNHGNLDPKAGRPVDIDNIVPNNAIKEIVQAFKLMSL